jgi:hypothetical protein
VSNGTGSGGLDVYSHVVPGMRSAAAERIAEMVFASDEPGSPADSL